ncbi:MAG TPA: FxsA family protein [Solirubrobacteraceae bacterium]
MFVLILIAVPVLEALVLVEVAHAIGWPVALLLLAASSLLGMRLVRIEGRAALQRISTAVSERRQPARTVLDGALRFLGSLLLAIPGFLTDMLGALLLLRPTRTLALSWVSRRYAARLMSFIAGAGRFAPSGRRNSWRPPADVDSTAFEDDLGRLGH